MKAPGPLDRRSFLATAVLAPLALAASGAPAVMTGLDVVVAAKGEPLLGQRVGLLVHAASIGSTGEHAVDVLRGAGVKVTRIFGAEHGYRGLAAAGEKVEDGVDPKTVLP